MLHKSPDQQLKSMCTTLYLNKKISKFSKELGEGKRRSALQLEMISENGPKIHQE